MKHHNLHIYPRHRANFKTLGISPTTDFSVVRTAFKAKALALHPDKTHNGDRAAFQEAKQAMEELEFLKEYPILTGSVQEQMDEEEEEEEAREELAREEEARTGNRWEKKKSQEGSYAWVAGEGKHAIDGGVEQKNKSEMKTSGMVFVMKRKPAVTEKQHESNAEAAQRNHANNQQERSTTTTMKKKQFPTTKDKLNEARARTNIHANTAASSAHNVTNRGRHTYDDFFEKFGDAGEDCDRDDEYVDMREQRRGNW